MLHYDSMASLTAVLGDSPRVRVLEALVRLSGLDYTRAELAREAGLYRMTTNRMIEELERQGLVDRVGRGKRPLFGRRSIGLRGTPEARGGARQPARYRRATHKRSVEIENSSAGEPRGRPAGRNGRRLFRRVPDAIAAWPKGRNGLSPRPSRTPS